MRIIIGIILIVAGFLMTWKTSDLVGFTGQSTWAEAHLGTEGGTYLMYKLIGIGLIILGLLAVTGLYQGFLEATVGRLLFPTVPGQ